MERLNAFHSVREHLYAELLVNDIVNIAEYPVAVSCTIEI